MAIASVSCRGRQGGAAEVQGIRCRQEADQLVMATQLCKLLQRGRRKSETGGAKQSRPERHCSSHSDERQRHHSGGNHVAAAVRRLLSGGAPMVLGHGVRAAGQRMWKCRGHWAAALPEAVGSGGVGVALPAAPEQRWTPGC